ncbi:MAG TPA: hypothetical protein VMD53_14710 [Rhizomicrobium sp.]|nr:hypothetical protein [Rhizomicrobium sp.]
MKPVDYAKALVLAFVIMAVLMLLGYPVVGIYSVLIAPGHLPAFYHAATTGWLLPWWVHIGGLVLFFFAGWLFTGRVRHRNAYAFMAAMCVWYLIIEILGIIALGGTDFFASGGVAWLVPQFAAAFAGVLLARLTLPPGEQPIP